LSNDISVKKTNDYHEERDSERFQHWFENQLIPNIPANSTIIMDNASYHSVQIDKRPTMSSRKSVMVSQLQNHNIDISPHLKKVELYEIIRQQNFEKRYVIDEIAQRYGHYVLRIPPYNCQFNALELVLSQVKDFIGKNNKTFKLKDIESLLHLAVQNVTSKNWANDIQHVQNLVEEFRKRDGLLEEIIINLGESDNETDFDSD
jgi:transposase